MMKLLTSILAITMLTNAYTQVKLQFENNITPTYNELISSYQYLADQFSQATLLSYGLTDSGRPLHLFVISSDMDFNPLSIRAKDRRIVLINNGIHPGEPCGVDASLKLADDILNDRHGLEAVLQNTVVCIIPVLNVGGMLNRSPFHRTNQNGPLEHGFRANAKNQDLNRDFVKMDARNTRTFAELFHEWDPDVFVDTHTTNGSDYPYVMTIIPTRHEKLDSGLGLFLKEKMTPYLFSALQGTPYEITPYVQTRTGQIESGIVGFMDSPRYTTGFTSLFNTLGFITEAHSKKPFSERVMATWQFLIEILKFSGENSQEIGALRKAARYNTISQKEFVIQWSLDTTVVDSFLFRGYASRMITSAVTGHPRIIYDPTLAWKKMIPYFNTYSPTLTVEKPDFYIIPQAWEEVISKLQINGVRMKRFSIDTLLFAEAYYIENYNTSTRPNNGRYLHGNVTVRKEIQPIPVLSGDYLIETNQSSNNLILQTLEPHAVDSYFCWNFFDAILSRKEYFSSWLFEDYAEEFLAKNPGILKEFEERKGQDKSFASSAFAQLNFIYERSPFAEISYLRYPIFRLNHKGNLPVE